MTVIIECEDESAEQQFQEMVDECADELLFADRETLTLRFRVASGSDDMPDPEDINARLAG